jgi:hypothetical protein
MEANHNNSMTLHAHNKNGKTRFYKKIRLWSTSLKTSIEKATLLPLTHPTHL